MPESSAPTLEPPPSNGTPKRRTRKPAAPRAPRKVTPKRYVIEAYSPEISAWQDEMTEAPLEDRAECEAYIRENGEDGTRYRIVCILRECKVQAETVVRRKLT